MKMLLNKYLPDFHFNEFHSKKINGNKEEILNAINSLKIRDISKLMNILMSIRSLTIRNRKKENFNTDSLLLEEMQKNKFFILEISNNEIVIGLIGQFCNLFDTKKIQINSSKEYLDFNIENYGVVATNFFVKERQGKSILSTETRIKIEDPKSRRKFAIYWFFIYIGSSLIRKLLLNAIKRKTEKKK